jgi:peptidoglycan/xylan/chitin deacetylase (PgdA/CDA1 family)
MEIGSHTVTHPDLTTLGFDQIRAELAESRAAIEAAIGAPVASFCYPAGRFDDDVAALAHEAGYLSATTTMPDLPEGDLMRLPRLRVEGSYGAAEVGWLIQ